MASSTSPSLTSRLTDFPGHFESPALSNVFLRFDHTPAEIERFGRQIIELNRKLVDERVAAGADDPDLFWRSVSEESYLDNLGENLDMMFYVHPDPEVRKKAQQVSTELAQFGTEVMQRDDYFKLVSNLRAKSEDRDYTAEQRVFLDRLDTSFRRTGVQLEGSEKAEFKRISDLLTQLQTEFTSALNEYAAHLDFTADELDGISEEFLKSLERVDEKYRVKMVYPHIRVVQRDARHESTRRRVAELYGRKCADEKVANHRRLERIVQLRHQKATLLGYPSFADFALANRRMAEKPVRVEALYTDLERLIDSRITPERERLTKFQTTLEIEEPETLSSWNLSYVEEQLRKSEYALDQREIQQYFPLEQLVSESMEVYSELLGLKIVELDRSTLPENLFWHESVKLFRVDDDRTDDTLGYFYLDLHPRDGKYQHACAGLIQSGFHDGTRRIPPVSVMICNFTASTEEQPSLLMHREVVTFFHELGHVFHQVLGGRVTFINQSGSRVERDFVEAPSQCYENYCFRPEFLKRVSRHTETGEPLPDELIAKIRETKNLTVGIDTATQMVYGGFDFELHRSEPPADFDVVKTYHALAERQLAYRISPDSCFPASFGHVGGGGYAAGYYGYLWSKVYSAELFKVFADSGDVFSPEVGRRYRELILERGGTRDSWSNLVEFLGREPTIDAFVEAMDA